MYGSFHTPSTLPTSRAPQSEGDTFDKAFHLKGQPDDEGRSLISPYKRIRGEQEVCHSQIKS